MLRPFVLLAAIGVAAFVQAAAQPAPSTDSSSRRASSMATRCTKDGRSAFVAGRIEAAGPAASVTAPGATVIELPGQTLMPGMIEGHSHVLLHAYNETSWNDQVLKESLGLRTARAVNHLKATLQAGFTTIRDLGTEGAAYADAELKAAVEQGIIPGPRMIVTTKAIVATGSYAPRGFAQQSLVPQGAEEADGANLVRVVRDQIGHGADWIKVYADYRWGARGEAAPTFSVEELTLIVQTARSSGRPVVAHASTAEGMRRSILAGVETIDHGDGGTAEIFKLMAERKVALVSDPGRRRCHGAVCRLEEGNGAGAGQHHAQARQLQDGARRRRHDPERQRCRRVSARRECARTRADGGVWHARDRRASQCDLHRRARAAHGRSNRPRARPGCSPTSWPSRGIRRGISRRCGASAS